MGTEAGSPTTEHPATPDSVAHPSHSFPLVAQVAHVPGFVAPHNHPRTSSNLSFRQSFSSI